MKGGQFNPPSPRKKLPSKNSALLGLKQEKVALTYEQVVNIYIVYEINLWSYPYSADFTLGNSLFGAVKLTKMSTLINILIQDIVFDLMHEEVSLRW